MILKLKRTPGIYLVGFMGCGKSTIGRLLARELGWSFVDIDDDIEAAARCTITEIFEQRGEPAFRTIEAESIAARVRMIEKGHAAVVAMGGGAFAQENNFELLQENGVSIWLDCPFETLKQRVERAAHRPLARDPAKFAALYEVRREAYRRADFRIAIADDDPRTAVQQILQLPIF